MKKCSNCGYQNFDINEVCEKCNHPLPSPISRIVKPQPQLSQYQVYNAPIIPTKQNIKLKQATKTFLLIRTIADWFVFFAFLVLGLALTIIFDSLRNDSLVVEIIFQLFPNSFASFVITYIFMLFGLLCIAVLSSFMTFLYHNKLCDNSPVSLIFKLITYFLVSPLAGLLMPCDCD